MTDSSTAPIALLLESVVSRSGAHGCGKVGMTASERSRLVLIKSDCFSIL